MVKVPDGELKAPELRRMIKEHNKLMSIKIPPKTDRAGLIKLINDNGYKVDHANKKLMPVKEMKRKPIVKLPPAPAKKTKEEMAIKRAEATKKKADKLRAETEKTNKYVKTARDAGIAEGKKLGVKAGASLARLVVARKERKDKVPKGSHRMPDGTIMKDKDMPKKAKEIATQTEPKKPEPKKTIKLTDAIWKTLKTPTDLRDFLKKHKDKTVLIQWNDNDWDNIDQYSMADIEKQIKQENTKYTGKKAQEYNVMQKLKDDKKKKVEVAKKEDIKSKPLDESQKKFLKQLKEASGKLIDVGKGRTNMTEKETYYYRQGSAFIVRDNKIKASDRAKVLNELYTMWEFKPNPKSNDPFVRWAMTKIKLKGIREYFNMASKQSKIGLGEITADDVIAVDKQLNK